MSVKKRRVLVLDDEADLLDVVVILLSDDYEIETFTNPSKALDAASKTHYDCFVTDLNMPLMSGKDVILILKRLYPDVPVLVMSGHSVDDPEVKEAIHLGADDVVTKPFPDQADFLSLMRKYCA